MTDKLEWIEKSNTFGAPTFYGRLGGIVMFTTGWSSMVSGEKSYPLEVRLPGFREVSLTKLRFDTLEEAKAKAELVLADWLAATGLRHD